MATHKPMVGQERPTSALVPSTLVTVHAVAPPVGFVEAATLPASSTATHRLLEGHETALRDDPPKSGRWLTRAGAAHFSGPAGIGLGVRGLAVGVGSGGANGL